MIHHLPFINAILNSLSATWLAAGYFFIRRKDVLRHRFCMVAAFLTSSVFLASYLTFHWYVGNVRFLKYGWIRPVYFAILISHTILAVVILPLILRTLTLAIQGRFDVHRRWARWTLPLWFYVSVTGVVVYNLLY